MVLSYTRPRCGAYSRAALIKFFVPNAALILGRLLIEGGAYSSKYGIYFLFYLSQSVKSDDELTARNMINRQLPGHIIEFFCFGHVEDGYF